MTTPLVTTIIPTYRRPDTLLLAIKSVLLQGGPSLRVCVYDNASGDGTRAMVQEIACGDPRVQYHCHERNIGGLANFLFGLARVETPFFSVLSDDDLLLPGFFQQAVSELSTVQAAMFWAGLTVRMTADGTIYDARVEQWPREGLYVPPDGIFEFAHGKAPTWTGIVFRREVLTAVGTLDPEVNAPADLDFLLRVAARHPFFLRKQAVAVFLLNQASFSEHSPLSAHWPGWLKMIGNVAGIESLPAPARARIAAMLHEDARRMLFRRSANAIRRRNHDFARQASEVLSGYYRQALRAVLIRSLATACSALPPVQWLYSRAYGLAEQRLLRGRSALQSRYAAAARFRAELAADGTRLRQAADLAGVGDPGTRR